MSGIDYEAIRERPRPDYLTRLEDLNKSKEEVYEKAVAENNYWDVLESDSERVKADTNNDRIITYDEYREYLISQSATEIPKQNMHENYYNTHHYYHLDYTFIIGVGIICLTAIIISLINRK